MRAVVDTSVLLAIVNVREPQHESCGRLFRSFSGTLLSTEPVLTEALHMLSERPDLASLCMEIFERGAILVAPTDRAAISRCRQLMRKYADLPMDYADATLVCLAEQLGTKEVWTLDRRDFGAYRLGGRVRFEIRPH